MNIFEKHILSETEPNLLTSRVEFLMRLRRVIGSNTQLLNAFEKLPREAFVDAIYRDKAYLDTCWALKFGQTTTRPSIIGLVLNSLKIEPYHKILEIGTGSGYGTAILSAIGCKVYSVDKFSGLITIAKLQVQEVLNAVENGENLPQFYTADGLNGLPNFAPFDRIIIWGRVNEIPKRLKIQLRENGVLAACLSAKKSEPSIISSIIIGKFVDGDWLDTPISYEKLPIITEKRTKYL